MWFRTPSRGIALCSRSRFRGGRRHAGYSVGRIVAPGVRRMHDHAGRVDTGPERRQTSVTHGDRRGVAQLRVLAALADIVVATLRPRFPDCCTPIAVVADVDRRALEFAQLVSVCVQLRLVTWMAVYAALTLTSEPAANT
jgi:hypothetical protein